MEQPNLALPAIFVHASRSPPGKSSSHFWLEWASDDLKRTGKRKRQPLTSGTQKFAPAFYEVELGDVRGGPQCRSKISWSASIRPARAMPASNSHSTWREPTRHTSPEHMSWRTGTPHRAARAASAVCPA